MDKNTNHIGALLAGAALLGLFAITGGLFFLDIPDDNIQLVNISLMAFVSCVSTGFGYFLGSSLSTKKDDTPPIEPKV